MNARTPEEARLTAMLEALGVETRRYEHRPVFTVAESQGVNDRIPGAHTKNLFLKDRRGQFWLVTCRDDRAFRIRALEKAMGAKNCSFARADALMERLGVAPGSVTTLAAINDPTHRVRIILDAALMKAEWINLHPLRNDATLSISPEGLRRFLARTGHAWRALDFDALAPAAAGGEAPPSALSRGLTGEGDGND